MRSQRTGIVPVNNVIATMLLCYQQLLNLHNTWQPYFTAVTD